MLVLFISTLLILFFFFFNDTATTEIYTLSLHDALPILKNKLFVFGGAFGLLSSSATTQVATVETPQFVQFVQTNFPNNLANTFFKQAPPAVLPTANILTVAQVQARNPGFFSSSAFPADLPAVGTAFFPESLTHNAYQWHFRVDYNVNESKDRIFYDMFRT